MSYEFSLAEQAQIQAAIDASNGLIANGDGTYRANDVVSTNAVPLYQTLSDIITSKLWSPVGLDAATIEQLQDARRWLNVAIGANGNTGMHAVFIRTYTDRQGMLRN